MTHEPEDPLSEPTFRPPPSPASLLPPRSKLKGSFAERFGDDRTIVNPSMMAFIFLMPVFMLISALVSSLVGLSGITEVVAIVAGGVAMSGGVMFGSMFFARRSGLGVARFVHPDGKTTPYQRTWSHVEALAARGQVDDALAAYEAEIRVTPRDLDLAMRAANLYLAHKKDPARTADLLRVIRKAPHAPPASVLYASQRLVDLYLGPLNDKGRAIVELRMMVDRFPGSAAAGFAREGLDRLKREHHGEP